MYTVRVAKDWNELPEKVKIQTSINGFKNYYDKWQQSKASEAACDDGKRDNGRPADNE